MMATNFKTEYKKIHAQLLMVILQGENSGASLMNCSYNPELILLGIITYCSASFSVTAAWLLAFWGCTFFHCLTVFV